VTLVEAVLLALAGAGAGAVNAVAGGGSLLSFSALLGAGYSPVTANATNSVAVLPGYLGGALSYAPELRGQGPRVGRLALASAVGALAGAALLIAAPPSVFELVAPILILASCGLLAAQPLLAGALARPGSARPPGLLHLGQFAAGLYGGYFAAGLGVLLLAVLGLLLPGEDDLQRLNALKGALSLIIGTVAAATYALFGPVAWSAVAVMAVGAFAGGHAGVSVARRLPEAGLRWGIVAVGTAVAVALLVERAAG
jgi:uncharacterized membrane protein YfcA